MCYQGDVRADTVETPGIGYLWIRGVTIDQNLETKDEEEIEFASEMNGVISSDPCQLCSCWGNLQDLGCAWRMDSVAPKAGRYFASILANQVLIRTI